MSSKKDFKMNKSKPLLVYSASAGSGKTFRLVLTYLEILLHSNQATKKFRSIVAMTFTNKAALEMKNRIINGLYQLVNKHDEAKFLQAELINKLEITEDELQQRASIAFREILHNYEDFQVSTIDKFNLKLIRSFSRDLDISGDFDVIMNEKDLLEEVIELLMSKIGLPDEQNLTNLLHFYALSNLEDGEKWNFKDKLIDFASIIGNEKYSGLLAQLQTIDFSTDEFKKLKSQLRQMDLEMVSKCREVYTYFSSFNYTPADLYEKSNSYNDFMKLAEINRFPNFDRDKGSFLGKSIIKACKKNEESPKFDVYLSRQLLALNERYLSLMPQYQLLSKYKEHFFNMALLQEISSTLASLKKDQQLIRISDFNQLIGSLVQGEEAPYIYERLGTRLHHFLLDEFQDTSRLQWLNLIPLLHESIGHEHQNLIVGDPKQSIYRFNNGKAEQFVSLPSLYNPEKNPSTALKSAYFEKMGELKNLDVNFRSSEEIVAFNNNFFGLLKEKMSSKAADFYASFTQKINSEHSGLVEINSRKIALKNDELYPLIQNKIDECIEDGFKLGDIAILTEKNAQGNNIANYLTEQGYAVVSSDSLLVQHNLKIKLMISYLKRRVKPNNETEAKRFAETFLRLKHEEDYLPLYLSFFDKEILHKGKSIKVFNDSKFISTYFNDSANFFVTYESVYDLVLQFIKSMNWIEEEDPYVHHLLDFIYEFQLTNEGDIRYFLDYYDLKKEKLALVLPETDRAINIMSIHKSKGLEFPVVILPFLNFDTGIKSGSKYLVEADDKILYTALSKDSPVDCLKEMAKEELELIALDKINLLYVALTRPEFRLYGFNEYSSEGLGSTVHECLQQIANPASTSDDLNFKSGGRQLKPISQKKKRREVSFFHPSPLSDRLWYPDIVFQKQREELVPSAIQYGNAFHLVISEVETSIELTEVVERIIENGEIEASFKERLIHDANVFLQKADDLGLCRSLVETLNETDILADENILIRPDKIWVSQKDVNVIEIKTGIAKPSHVSQLKMYQRALEQIFTKPVNAYLYYVTSKEFLPV